MTQQPAEHDIAPQINARDAGPRDHFVQVYEACDALISSVASYIGAGLGAGDAAIVIASKEYREALDLRLLTHGFSVAALKTRGQYMTFDAAEMLAKLTVSGRIDDLRFREVVRPIIQSALDSKRRVRVFGEAVALLCASGKVDDAIKLEELWNDLRKSLSFSLFCAYPMHLFRGCDRTTNFLQICKEHDYVIPTEAYWTKNSTSERLRCVAWLQQRAGSLDGEIAARQSAEYGMREEHSKFELAVGVGDLGIWEYHPDTNRLTCSVRCRELLGLESIEAPLTHDRLLQFVHPEDRQATGPRLEQAVADGRDFDGQFRIVSRSGEIRKVRMACRYFHTDGPTVMGVVSDVTVQ